MYRYRIGDVCPFCGQPIPQTATTDQLYAVSLAASAMKLPPPDKPVPDIVCCLVDTACPADAFTDGRCCRVCPKFGKCAPACLNTPKRCGLAEKMTVRAESYDAGGA